MVGIPVLLLPRVWVQSLFRELRYCKLCDGAKKTKTKTKPKKTKTPTKRSNLKIPRLNKEPKITILFRINQVCKRNSAFITLIELC